MEHEKNPFLYLGKSRDVKCYKLPFFSFSSGNCFSVIIIIYIPRHDQPFSDFFFFQKHCVYLEEDEEEENSFSSMELEQCFGRRRGEGGLLLLPPPPFTATRMASLWHRSKQNNTSVLLLFFCLFQKRTVNQLKFCPDLGKRRASIQPKAVVGKERKKMEHFEKKKLARFIHLLPP